MYKLSCCEQSYDIIFFFWKYSHEKAKKELKNSI